MSSKEIICVLGDSFAGHRNNALWNKSDPSLNKPWSWVNLLESNNASEMLGMSFPGQSYFHQRRWYLQNMLFAQNTSETVLILVHTSPWRLPHQQDVPVTAHILTADKNNSDSNEIYSTDPTGSLFDLAKIFFTSNLFVDDFYASVFYSWLAELPELTRKYKKVIHLFGFESRLNNLPDKFTSRFYVGKLLTDNAVVVTTPLVSLTLAEGEKNVFGGPDIGNGRANHFNAHNNQQLYQEIVHIIENVPGGTFYDLNLDHWDLKDKSKLEKLKLHRDNFDPTNPVNNPLI